MKITTTIDPLAELTAAVTLGRQLAATARAELKAATASSSMRFATAPIIRG